MGKWHIEDTFWKHAKTKAKALLPAVALCGTNFNPYTQKLSWPNCKACFRIRALEDKDDYKMRKPKLPKKIIEREFSL